MWLLPAGSLDGEKGARLRTIDELIKICEADLKSGQPETVAKRLSRLSAPSVPRNWRLPLANVCRRAGLISLGMKLLAHEELAPREQAEYAVLLERGGALGEALEILESLDASQMPEVRLYQATCLMSQYQPERALIALEDYLRGALSPYAKLVAHLNYATALVATSQYLRAGSIIEESIAAARLGQYARLEGNSLELRAQIHITAGNLKSASQDLEAAARLFTSARPIDQLSVRKWQAYIRAVEMKSVEPLQAFRREAIAYRNWEGVREADLLALKISMDADDLDYLYFGTPMPYYRERIRRELGQAPASDKFLLGSKGSPQLDLLSGEITGGGVTHMLKPGSKSHQLLDSLLRDFYRPLGLGSLFNELFPGEHFDIYSSPDRVHQVIRRSRRWLEDAQIPIEIHEDDGAYSVRISGPFSILVPLDRKPIDWHDIQLERLRQVFGDSRAFSAREARDALGLSIAPFKRLVTWALENGRLERHGASTATLYSVPSLNKLSDRAA